MEEVEGLMVGKKMRVGSEKVKGVDTTTEKLDQPTNIQATNKQINKNQNKPAIHTRNDSFSTHTHTHAHYPLPTPPTCIWIALAAMLMGNTAMTTRAIFHEALRPRARPSSRVKAACS